MISEEYHRCQSSVGVQVSSKDSEQPWVTDKDGELGVEHIRNIAHRSLALRLVIDQQPVKGDIHGWTLSAGGQRGDTF